MSLSCHETFLVVWFSCHANHPAMQSDIWGDRCSGYLDNSIWERLLLYICEKSISLLIPLNIPIGLPYLYNLFLECMAKCMMLHLSLPISGCWFAKCHIWQLYFIYQLSEARASISLSLSLSHSEKKSQYEWIVCVVWQLNSYLGFFHTHSTKNAAATVWAYQREWLEIMMSL